MSGENHFSVKKEEPREKGIGRKTLNNPPDYEERLEKLIRQKEKENAEIKKILKEIEKKIK